MNNDALREFRAESLLGDDSFILKQIGQLKYDLRYSSEGNEVSLDAHYERMNESVNKIPRIVLDTAVPPGTEDEYGTRLSTAYEQILDNADQTGGYVLEFQSRLKNAEREIKRLKTEFGAWYVLACNLMISAHQIKFPPNQVKGLSDSEFTRLIDGADVQVENLLALVDHLHESIKNVKKIGSEKYNLGRDQINLSYTSKMANSMAPLAPSQANDLAQVREEEDETADVPAYISKRPGVGSRTTEVTTVPAEDEPPAPTEALKKLMTEPPAAMGAAVAEVRRILDNPDPEREYKFVPATNAKPLPIETRVMATAADPDEVAAFLNNPAPGPSSPRRKLLLTEDEDLM